MKRLLVRSKLYLLILLALVPLCLLQGLGIYNRYEHAIEQEMSASEEYARAVNTALLNYFHYLWDFEQLIGTTILNAGLVDSPDALERILNHKKYDIVHGLAWIDPDGTIIASTGRLPRGYSLKNTQTMQRILTGEEKVVSDLYLITSIPVIYVSRGIYIDQRLVGVVSAMINADELGEFLPKGRKALSGTFGFVDRQGVIVYRDQTEIAPEKRKVVADSPIYASLRGETTFSRGRTSGLTGERRLGVTIPFPQIGWATFSTIAVEELLGDLQWATARDIVILIVVTVLSLGAAVLISKRIVAPVHRLQEAATAISKGDLQARVSISGRDELAVTGATFNHMAERIQQLEESREIFLQTAAHELRNPMAGIKGILALIRRNIDAEKPIQYFKDKFDLMEREIDRLSKLLNQILEAYRVQREEGLHGLNLATVDLVGILNTAIQPFQNMETHCQFILAEPLPSSVMISGDYARLDEVFRNLFSNANKYSPDGGTVQVVVQQNGDFVLVSVKDQGIGIPKDHLHTVFDCFHRAQNMKNDPGGIGLGLYFCKRIVEGHAGQIWVESEEGVGSTFFVRLPVLKGE